MAKKKDKAWGYCGGCDFTGDLLIVPEDDSVLLCDLCGSLTKLADMPEFPSAGKPEPTRTRR